MPRYYFHVRNGDKLLEDRVGVELPDVAAAHYEAQMSARDLLADNIRHEDELDDRTYEVWSDNAKPLFILPFKSVIGGHD